MRKVLILTYDFPYPLNSGGKSRIYNLIKFSKDKNIEFFLVSFVRDSYKKTYNEELEKIGVSKIKIFKRKKTKNPGVLVKTVLGSSSIFKNLYKDPNVEYYVTRLITEEKIDTVLYESFYTSFYISDKIKKLGVRQIFGTENIEHLLYYDYAASKPKIFKKFFLDQVTRVRREEEKAYAKADLILAVTKEEEHVISQTSKTPVSVIPNGIDSSAFSFKPKKTVGKKLLFVGNFAYFPNIDAMDFFYKNVFLNIPDATITVVGKNQNKLPFLMHDTRVNNIEYVEDLKSAYYDADIFVFPVRFGGGTNFKVLEAASCGTPILAIPDRVKGLGMEPDKHFVAAKTPTEFLAGIRRLNEEKNLGDSIAKNARKLVEKEYDWREIGIDLRKVFEHV